MTPSMTPKKSSSKMLSTLLVVGLLLLVVIVDMKRRAAEKELQKLSMRLEQLNGDPEKNKAVADSMVKKVRQLMFIDPKIEPTVATIVDVDVLRKQNAFYDAAQNGDVLVVTTTRAILYRPDAKGGAGFIVDVVPVTIQPPSEAQAQVQGQPTSSAPAKTPPAAPKK